MIPTGILETVLYVKDLAAVEGFYRDVLGLAPFAKVASRHLFYRCGDQVLLIFNPEYKVVPAVIPGYTILSGVQITYQGLLVIAVSLALFALVFLFLTYTRQGMAIRAVSQQMEAASLMSIPVERTYAMVIAISGARPSDGSSMSRMSALDMRPRPSASMRRSPPERVRVSWPPRSLSHGNRS